MKKIILLLAVALLAGCHPMDRINETDPLAGAKYKGMTYLGEIGSFSMLSDFTVAVDPTDSKYYIFAVDSFKQEIDKYSVDGTPVDIYPNPTPPFPQPPTGICEMNGYCYIIDAENTVAFNIMNIAAWQDSMVKGNKILSYSNTNTLYSVVSDPPGVASFVPAVSPTPFYAPGTPWVIIKGDTTCANCMSYISDIAVNKSANQILLIDSVKKRISVFEVTGVLSRQIDIGSDISSAAVWESSNTLYVPTTDGIRRYNYGTGVYIDTIANFGEGNGRVMKPGPIELYQGQPPDNKYYIFVGAGTFIKVFQIASL